MNKIIKMAESMAMERSRFRTVYRRWQYRITDNPYKGNKKSCVIWHNAFYDKCREIGRGI